MDLYDEIYYSLMGELDPPLPWVSNAFAPDSPCLEAYARMCQARQRLLDRLGSQEDRDLEEILHTMEQIARLLCRQSLALRRL